jgi:glycosyltransferase involved in cell wall biosynthesis
VRIVQLTPGTGNFYCGHCLRDNALARTLRRRGHDVFLVPLYLPSLAEDADASAGVPIFFGGINVYLEEKIPALRRAPQWLTRFLDSPFLLRASAHLAGMTAAHDLGALTVSMLRGEEGHQLRELGKLTDWLKTQPRPDVICLSTALLVGLARELKRQFGAPVVSTFQGEDGFLDSLPEPYRAQSWQLLSERAPDVDRFIGVSRYFADVMGGRLGLPSERVEVVRNGIDLGGFEPAQTPPSPPTIGYLARMCKAKGLDTLVDAFLELRRRNRVPHLKLRIAGAKTRADEAFVRNLHDKLSAANLADDVEWHPNLERAQKQSFLRSLTVLSVPALYGEAFGLYVLEALASGVPVVQPRHAAFPEVLAETGGGRLYEPTNPTGLADGLEELLLQPDQARQLGEQGRNAVREKFSVEQMAGKVEDVLENVVQRTRTANGVRV